MAGTTPRTGDPATDAKLAASLLASGLPGKPSVKVLDAVGSSDTVAITIVIAPRH